MGEVVRVFSANLLFHLCSPPALQPRPAKRHFTSHPHTHGARANTQKHTHTLRGIGHTPTKRSLSLTDTHIHAHTTGILVFSHPLRKINGKSTDTNALTHTCTDINFNVRAHIHTHT